MRLCEGEAHRLLQACRHCEPAVFTQPWLAYNRVLRALWVTATPLPLCLSPCHEGRAGALFVGGTGARGVLPSTEMLALPSRYPADCPLPNSCCSPPCHCAHVSGPRNARGPRGWRAWPGSQGTCLRGAPRGKAKRPKRSRAPGAAGAGSGIWGQDIWQPRARDRTRTRVSVMLAPRGLLLQADRAFAKR